MTTEVAGSALVCTIDWPERANALSLPILEQLLVAVARAEREGHVLVLTGAGTTFCSGAYVQDLEGPDRERSIELSWEVILRVQDAGIATVAALNGPAVAGGLELALGCDLRVAGPEAFLRPRGAVWGAVTSARLARFLPLGLATQSIWLEERIEVGEAARWGLVNRAVESRAEVSTAALELAERLGRIPPHVVRASRRLLREPPGTWAEVIEAQAAATHPVDPVSHLRS